MSGRHRGLGTAIGLVLVLALAACTGGSKTPKHDEGSVPTAKVVMQARSLTGGAASSATVDAAVGVLRQRLDTAGVSAQLQTSDTQVDVAVASSKLKAIGGLLSQVGVLRFRQVLGVAPGSAANRPSSPSSSPSAQPTRSSWRVPRQALAGFYTYNCHSGADGSVPTPGPDQAADYTVGCDKTGAVKYLLGPSALGNAQVGHASVVANPQTKDWLVEMGFTGTGPNDWFALTKKAYEADPDMSMSRCSTPNLRRGCNEIAIVLDGIVLSAPASQQDGIRGGQAQITGPFTKQEAHVLADVVQFPPLPVHLVIQTATTG